jgi:hypothetical protein
MVCDFASKADLSTLFKGDSIFEIPQAFLDFNDPTLIFLTTPFDVSTLLEVSQGQIELPKLLRILHSPKYLGPQPYAPVWVKVFPRTPAPALACETWRNVVFSQVNRIEIFDFDLPVFERRYRMVQMMAAQSDHNPFVLLENPTARRETQVLVGAGVERSGAVSFFEFALNMELSDLRARALAFERLLVHRFVLQRLTIWSELIDASHRASINATGQKLLVCYFQRLSVHDVLHNTDRPSDVLRNLCPLFDSARNRQFFYAMRAEILSSAYKQAGELMALGVQWNATMQRVFSETPMPDMFRQPKMQKVVRQILELVNALSNLDSVPFYRRYFRMIEIFRWLDFFENCFDARNVLFEYAVALCHVAEFIPTVVKISALLIKNNDFLASCDKHELILWYKFEAVIMNRVQSDPQLFARYSQVHDNVLVLI